MVSIAAASGVAVRGPLLASRHAVDSARQRQRRFGVVPDECSVDGGRSNLVERHGAVRA
jgi:hypothetical protein